MLYQRDQKAIEVRHRACKLLKTHAPNEVPSHKKHLRQLRIQKKKGRGPSNYRVWKRKRRVIRSWGAVVCLSGSFLSLSNPLPLAPLSFFLSSSSLCIGQARLPIGWSVWPFGFWQMIVGHCSLARAGFSPMLMLESGLQKSISSKKDWRALGTQVAEHWGFCGLVEIQRPTSWGVSGLASGEAKLKSSWAAQRVKREGFGKTRHWLEQGLTRPIYNTYSQRLRCYLWCFNTKIAGRHT